MFFTLSRSSASRSLRVATLSRAGFVLFFASATAANAVVVRGHVTDALGKPVPGARVQLIEAGKVEALAYAGPDGSFEIRDADSGRFTLLGSAQGFFPAIGQDFYSGSTDVIQQEVVLAQNTVKQDISVTATGIPTPLPQLTSPVSIIPGEAFATRVGVVDEMRLTPGAYLVQTGQYGGVTSLFMRGGNSTANLVLIDGVPAEDVGGTFDFGTVSSTGVGRMELYRGPNSAIFGTDAGSSVISIETPRGTTLKPVFNYSGDAGNLHTWRNEITAGGTLERLDYFGGFSRFDTSNALPDDQYHSGTWVANVGYNINGNTSVRATLRDGNSEQGLPDAHDFYGISDTAKESDRDLYSSGVIENRMKSSWHNLVRYGISRKHLEDTQFGVVGTPVTFNFGTPSNPDYYTEYFGNTVTIRGANGYSGTGQASFLFGNSETGNDRNELYYQSDYTFNQHFTGLFGFRFDDEHGVFNDVDSAKHETVQRTNFEYNLNFQGSWFGRLFYTAGGAVEKNHLYGIRGTPRLGLAYAPVRSATGWFHGTRLRANAATGVQEPTLALEYASLYEQLLQIGDTADIAKYHIGPPDAQLSRTYDLGVDQNIYGEKLVLKAGYFHNVFDRQLEQADSGALAQYFNITVPPSIYNYYLYVNSLAFRAQGAEGELLWHPVPRLLFRTGYNYLLSRVLQSFSSDAYDANSGFPNTNLAFPNIPIGNLSPLVGARPFRRPPHTGYFDMQYTGTKWTFAMKGAYASRADDSTFLGGYDMNFGNSLLLPNRDLDFGYLKLDMSGTYQVRHNIQIFTQIDNLLNNQHIGPIGYPGLPLTFRTGLKFRLGGD